MAKNDTNVFGAEKHHGYTVGDLCYTPVPGQWPYWRATAITRNPGSEDWPARQFPYLIYEVSITNREYDAAGRKRSPFRLLLLPAACAIAVLLVWALLSTH